MNTNEAQELIESAYSAVHRRDLAELVTLFAEDCEFVDVPTGDTFNGREAFRAYMADTWASFPDFRPVNPRFVVQDGMIAAELEIVGTHEGTFLGHPATGREVRWPAAAFYVLTPDGRQIAKETYYYNLSTLLEQLTVRATDASVGTRGTNL